LSASLTAGTYAIISTSGYAFNGTITSGHGNATSTTFSFTSNIANSAPAGTCELTLIVVSGGYKLYNAATNKYLYAKAAKSGNLAWQDSEDSYWYFGDSNLRYKANNAYLQSYDGDSYRTYANKTGTAIQLAKKITISTYSNYCTSLTETVAISSAGLATYASDYALDYTNVEDIEAYIAKEEGSTVKLYQVKKVPAGTGVLLRSTNSGTEFVVPITTADPDDVSGNIFVRGTGAPVASVADGKHNYILNEIGGVLGFYKANDKMVATNRAYLQTIVASARIALDFDDETTGIKSMDNGQWTMDNVYDMQGRKVDAPKKGLYIINGRKVVIK
jgi:hypothetical protein